MPPNPNTTPQWNHCFICASKVPKVGKNRNKTDASSSVTSRSARVKNLCHYLFNPKHKPDENDICKDVIDSVDNGRGTLKLCHCCDLMTQEITQLKLELDIVQMKIVDRVKTISKAIVANSRLFGSNLEAKQSYQEFEALLEKSEGKGKNVDGQRRMLDVLHRFQTMAFDNDGKKYNVPLVYLHRMNNMEHIPIPVLEDDPQFDLNKVKLEDNFSNLSCSGEDGDFESSAEVVSDFGSTCDSLADLNDILKRVGVDLVNPSIPSQCPKQVDPGTSHVHRRTVRKSNLATKAFSRKLQRRRPYQWKVTKERIRKALQPQLKSSTITKRCMRRVYKDPNIKLPSNPAPPRKEYDGPPKQFPCPLCSWQFDSFYSLQLHLPVHSETKDLICEICGFATKTEHSLKWHTIRCHDDSMTYKFKCNVCSKISSTRQLHNIHVLTRHTNEQPFQCESCGIRFNNPRSLKRHSKLHVEGKPYVPGPWTIRKIKGITGKGRRHFQEERKRQRQLEQTPSAHKDEGTQVIAESAPNVQIQDSDLLETFHKDSEIGGGGVVSDMNDSITTSEELPLTISYNLQTL